MFLTLVAALVGGHWQVKSDTSFLQLIFTNNSHIQDMARLYPRSRFIGVDMADVFPTTNIPPNVKFRIMNAGSTFDFDDASFDFVFQRFLVMGLSVEQYVRSVQEMKRVLKPGGAIEIMELVNDYKNAGPAFSQIASWSK